MAKKLRPALFLMSAIAASGAVTATAQTQEIPETKSEKIAKAYKDLGDFSPVYVFENLKTSDLETLPSGIRLDMLDYWKADSTYKTSNNLGGLTWVEKLTDNYMKVQVSPVSTFEIKILPYKKEKIAMTIYTVGDDVQAQDSSVKFYDMELKELPADKFFKTPELKEFFEIPKGSATKMKEIEQMIPFPTMAYSIGSGSDVLTARLTVAQYINEDDWNIAKLFVKESISFRWEKDKFRLIKK